MNGVRLRMQSIKRRLVLFALLCAVPPIAFSVVQLHQQITEIRAGALRDARASTERLQARMRLQFTVAEVAAQMAAAIDFSSEGGILKCNESLRRSLASPSYLRQVSITDAAGVLVCSSSPVGTGFSVADRRYFRDATRLGRPVLSEFIHTRSNNLPSLVLALPIFDAGGTLQGMAMAVFDAPQLTRDIVTGDSLVLAVLDRTGALASSSLADTRIAIGAPASSVDELPRAASEREPVQMRWLDERERLYFARPLQYQGEPVLWVVAGADARALEMQAYRQFAIGAALMLLMAAGVALLAVLIIRPLVLGRLKGLMDAARDVSAGRYGARVQSGIDDEVATVEQAFNQMVDAVEADRLSLARSEHRFRLLFESSLDGVLAGRPTGEVLTANEQACRILGMSLQELIEVGRSTLRPTEPAKMRQLLESRQRSGTARGELTLVRGDGSLVDVEIASTIGADRDGDPVAWTVIHDVTDRKRAQREIEQLNRDLESRVAERTRELALANQEMEAFSASVSHDLRTPVGAVRGFAQVLLEKQCLSGKELGYLQRIKAAAEQMDKLIDALLALARLGRVQPELRTVDLAGIAYDVAQECRDATGRDVDFDVGDEGEVIGDPQLLRIVLSNLLSNAWKFTRNTAHPRVRVEFSRGNDGWTTVTVRDNGAGFDEAHASRLFQPFQRLHTAQEFPGIGIGLVTVSRIVQRHGGRIWAHGQPGAGAAFRFTLCSAQAAPTGTSPAPLDIAAF